MTVVIEVGWSDELVELVERADALAALAEAFADVRLGRGRVVVVTGEAGGGKSAVVRRFAADVIGRARVRVGSCDPLSTPRPLGPLHDVAVAGGRLAELVELGASPSDVFAALRDEISTDASSPSVVIVEDLHWADEATLDVVRLLARRAAALPVLLVVTLRSDLGRTHPARHLLGELAEVAERLVISRRTVDHHVAAIMRKLGASTRREAVARAAAFGLVAG